MMRIAIAMLVSVLVSGTAWAQITVPNTFSSGSPAYAAEVNQNFQTVVDALNAVTAGSAITQVGSLYGMSYGTDVAQANRNAWVYLSTDGVTYLIWLRYQNGSINVDGTTPTSFAYVEEYITVSTSDGLNVTSIGGSRRGTDDAPSAALRTFQSDSPVYANDGTFTTPVGGPRYSWVNYQITQAYLNVPFPSGSVTYPNSTSATIQTISDRTRLWTAYPASVTVNGMTFASNNLLSFDPTAGARIYSAGPGILVQSNGLFQLLYARKNVTEWGIGNLTGTPFGSGAALDGDFF